MVEMLGSLEPLSRHLLPPHLRHAPTRVEVGPGLWARTLAHPGQLARGLYGRGYLYHVQVAASIHIYTYLHQYLHIYTIIYISTPVSTYLQHKYSAISILYFHLGDLHYTADFNNTEEIM